MGCGCGKGAATAQPQKTVIKYEYNGQQFSLRADAETARSAQGGKGIIRTIATRV